VPRVRKLGFECKVSVVETGVAITHPNRNTSATNGMRALVIALFGLSMLLMLVILSFGWSILEGMLAISFAYVVIYAIIIWRVTAWARGPLALGAALAILLGIVSMIAFPTWADRDASGYASAETIWGSTGFSPGVLGMLTLLLAILQVVLIGACVTAFRQEWQVELEVPTGSNGNSSSDLGSSRDFVDDFDDGLDSVADADPDAW